jgi:hypothetical protein
MTMLFSSSIGTAGPTGVLLGAVCRIYSTYPMLASLSLSWAVVVFSELSCCNITLIGTTGHSARARQANWEEV